MTREEVLNNAYALGEPVDEANMKKAYDFMLMVKEEDGTTKAVCLGTWTDEKSATEAKEAIDEALKTASVRFAFSWFRVLSLTDEEFDAYTKNG